MSFGRRRPAALGRSTLGATLALSCAACEVDVGEPRLLWLLWLVPLVALLQVFNARARRGQLERFVGPTLGGALCPPPATGRALLRAGLVLLAVSCAVLALARLRYGHTWDEVQRHGVDIVVALDVSDSMLVQDVEKDGALTRLERAKRELRDLLPALSGDRVGLVAFAGAAFVQSPLTLDYGATEMFLAELSPESVPLKGTALGEAITVALSAFEGGVAESRAVLLITDGEDQSGEALAAAAKAKEAGVRVFAIGIGRDEGAPVPAEGGGFRRDERGELVLSRLDETSLRKIASTTGGRYVRSVTGDMDLKEIYEQGIRATVQATQGGSTRQRRAKDRFQWLLAIAAAALMLEALLPERRKVQEVMP